MIRFRYILAFWVSIALYTYLRPLLAGWPPEKGLLAFSSGWLLWALFTQPIGKLTEQFTIDRQNWLKNLLIHLVFAILVALLFLLMYKGFWAICRLLFLGDALPQVLYPNWSFAVAFPIYWQILFVAHGWYFYQRFQQTTLEAAQLKGDLAQARLEFLKAQLQPHFLFNSLNNIRALVSEAPESARQMLTMLAGVLRYAVDASDQVTVLLEQEMDAVNSYLAIEKIHYEERLHYTTVIAPETLSLVIPPMTVQLLVENALKHGIAQLPHGGTIEVRSTIQGTDWQIEVINSGQLRANWQPGAGLRNLTEHLNVVYQTPIRFTLQHLDNQSVLAQFTIPYAHAGHHH